MDYEKNYNEMLKRIVLHTNFMPSRAADEYADFFFNKNDDLDSWTTIRNAWLSGWDAHRLSHPEM